MPVAAEPAMPIVCRLAATQVPRRGTCKGVCPPNTRPHDLPKPTSDDTRSDEANLPERHPDTTPPAFTAHEPGPAPGDAPTTARPPAARHQRATLNERPPTLQAADHGEGDLAR